MRKLIWLVLLGALSAFPLSASAQNAAALSSVSVQFWPEYDDPSMLVLVDFQLAADTAFPVTLTFRLPAEADLIAVAADAGSGALMQFPYEGPAVEGEYKTFSMSIEQDMPYHFEYYQPLTFNGNDRLFSFLWDNAYAVESFQYSFLEPLDATAVELAPPHASVDDSKDLKHYQGRPVSLAAGESYALTIKYKKTTADLVAQPQTVQAAEPIDENTPGRVSLNSLPYIVGALGVILIAGGAMYYFQWGRAGGGKPRRRHMRADTAGDATSVYCSQCGSRAKPGDRFCRACGSRIRRENG